MTETLDDLLNKVEAIFDCKAGTPSELAKAINKPAQSVYDWVGQRRFKPNGDTALKIQQWAAAMMLRVAKSGSKFQSKFRQSYREVCDKRRPGNGRN
jgi:hypothetical protein